MEKLQPKMRFPEFKGDWKSIKLADITLKINSGKTPLGGESVYTNKGIHFIRSQNVLDSKLSFENLTYIDEKTNDTMKNSIVLPNDILLNITGASLGRSCVVPANFTVGNVNQHVCIIRLNDENNPNYIQSILASEDGQNRLKNLSTGSGREGLNFQSIKGLEIIKPTFPEQTKIASFLSAVDEKLNLLKDKKAALEEYKKGMMQKIFSQVIRFKDENGKDFAEWLKLGLGKFARITTGSSNREDSNLDGDYTFFDRSQDIRSSNRYLFDEEAIIVPGEGKEFVPKYFKGKFDLHQRTYAIMNFGDNNGLFLFYSITYNRSHLDSHAVGSTVKSLRLPMFESMPIYLPCIAEQTKIASFLFAIDEKIELVSKHLDETQNYKKGLLQQMFC